MPNRRQTNHLPLMSLLSHSSLQRDLLFSHLERKMLQINHHPPLQLQSNTTKLQQMSQVNNKVPLLDSAESCPLLKLKGQQTSLMWLSLMEKSKLMKHRRKHRNLSSHPLLSSRMSCFNILLYKVVLQQIKISKLS